MGLRFGIEKEKKTADDLRMELEKLKKEKEDLMQITEIEKEIEKEKAEIDALKNRKRDEYLKTMKKNYEGLTASEFTYIQ